MTSEQLQRQFMADRKQQIQKETEQNQATNKIMDRRVGLLTADQKNRQPKLSHANVKKAPYNLAAAGAAKDYRGARYASQRSVRDSLANRKSTIQSLTKDS